MKKYSYTCANRECDCLNQGIGLYFTTLDVKEAEEHSRINDSPMWIAEDENENA